MVPYAIICEGYHGVGSAVIIRLSLRPWCRLGPEHREKGSHHYPFIDCILCGLFFANILGLGLCNNQQLAHWLQRLIWESEWQGLAFSSLTLETALFFLRSKEEMAKINNSVSEFVCIYYLNPYFFTLNEGCILNIHWCVN